MEITLLLEFRQRIQLRQWLMENHSSAKECWIVISRSKNPPAGVLPYHWTELNKQRCLELENRGLMTQAGRDALERFLSAEESICGIRK